MGHVLQHQVQRRITKAVNQAIQEKAQQEAQKMENNWKGSFHCLVSGYYAGLTVSYMLLPFVIILILCAVGCIITEGIGYGLVFFAMAVLFWLLQNYGRKKMRVIVYWENGMAFYDKDGNEIVQLPQMAIDQMTVKNGSIIISWEEKKYQIIRNPMDNEKAVQEMLIFYGKDR